MKKKIIQIVSLILILSHILTGVDVIVYGEEKKISTVQENFFNEDKLNVVIGNVSESIKEAECLIATENCNVSNVKTAEESGVSTLIVIDNSKAIKKKQRQFILDVIERMLNEKQEYDKFAVVSLGSEMNTIVDFTEDRYMVLKGVEGISYEKQETCLWDGISKSIDLLKMTSDSTVKRMVVFSDGYSDEGYGETIDGVLEKLKIDKYPIYTIGYKSKKKKDNSSKDLFQLSRQTINEAGYLYSDEEDDVNDTIDYLNQIYDCKTLEIDVSNELMDGSVKPISITLELDNGDVIKIEKEEVYLQMAEKKEKPSASKVKKGKEKEEIQNNLDSKEIIIAIIVVIIIIVIVIIVTILRKVKKEKRLQDYDILVNGGHSVNESGARINPATRSFIEMDDYIERTVIDSSVRREKQKPQRNKSTPKINAFTPEKEQTVVLGGAANSINFESDMDRTVVLSSGSQNTCIIRLVDQMNNRVFEKEIIDEVIIGRNSKEARTNYISLDYNSSISKHHCKIVKQDDRFYIEDLGSLNHTFLHNRILLGREEIQNGEMIGIGNAVVKLEIKYL